METDGQQGRQGWLSNHFTFICFHFPSRFHFLKHFHFYKHFYVSLSQTILLLQILSLSQTFSLSPQIHPMEWGRTSTPQYRKCPIVTICNFEWITSLLNNWWNSPKTSFIFFGWQLSWWIFVQTSLPQVSWGCWREIRGPVRLPWSAYQGPSDDKEGGDLTKLLLESFIPKIN